MIPWWRYLPLVLVAGIILSQTWIFFWVYCPVYHPNAKDEVRMVL